MTIALDAADTPPSPAAASDPLLERTQDHILHVIAAAIRSIAGELYKQFVHRHG